MEKNSPGRPKDQDRERVHLMIDRKIIALLRRGAKLERRPLSQQAEIVLERGLKQS